MSLPGSTNRGKHKPRLGFLGIGWIGLKRLESVQKSDTAVIAAVCDHAEDKCLMAEDISGEGANVCTFGEMLEMDLDGIVIATPSSLHAAQTVAALEKGKAVFCQKPLGLNEKEAEDIVNTAKANNLLLGVDLSYRHTRGMKIIKDLIEIGDIGKIYAINFVFHNAYGPDKEWFYDPEFSGGGCALDLGTHLIDLALWTTGNSSVESVTGRLFSGGRELYPGMKSAEDFAFASLYMDDGVMANIACSWKLPAGQDSVIEATFYGTEGGLSFRNVEGSFYDFRTERYRGTSTEVLDMPPDEWGGRAILEWVEKLAVSHDYDSGIENSVTVSRILDILYRRQREWS